MNGLDFGTAIGLIKGLGSPDPAVIESAVSDWLDDHPEATTTVQDGSITKAKLDSNLQGTVDDVADLKSHFDVVEKSANLFDKSTLTHGYYFNTNPNSQTYAVGDLIPSGNANYAYVPIDGSGDYSWLSARDTYGAYYSLRVLLFDDNKAYLDQIVGTADTSDNKIVHFAVTENHITAGAVYFGYVVRDSDIGTAMIVKSSTYPSEYIPYYEASITLSPDVTVSAESIPSADKDPLYQKIAVFDGDSICADGASGGWAGYIGNANGMAWANVGVAGGTITAELYSGSTPRHWVSRYIDTIHTTYPELDYLILEGGTNDADLLTDEEIGTLDQANFTTFDDTTFIGALESLFYKAVSYYPSAKIGYIIPQRMGTWAGYGYEAGDSPSNRRRRKFFEIAIQVCEKWGIPYIDLWQGSPLCPKILSYYDPSMTPEQNTEAGKAYIDGQHLTQVGYNIISPKIEAWMKTL